MENLITLNSKLQLESPISLYKNPTITSNNQRLFFQFSYCPNLDFHNLTSRRKSSSVLITRARKKDSQNVLKPKIIEQISQDDGDEDEDDDDDEFMITDDFQDETFMDDEDYFEDEFETENVEVFVGDGAEGGGILLGGTGWDKEALAIAKSVTETFDGELGIYAFKTRANSLIQVRIEKLSTKSSSPSMADIEAFSAAYRARLDEAELAKTIPENITLEVSSPGVERVVRIPEELERFKERPMYVKYTIEATEGGSSTENDGVLRLISFDLETKCCEWGIADVRVNREKAGKGRPLSKKQRDWRLTTPFDSVRLARLYSEI